MVTVTIDRGLDEPVYGQVAAQIRHLIASGELPVGAVLPSVRKLAGDLGVSLNTVARAYRQLEAEGFLDIRDRAGVIVAAPAAQLEHADRARLLAQMRATLARLRQAGMEPDELLKVVRLEVESMRLGREEAEDG